MEHVLQTCMLDIIHCMQSQQLDANCKRQSAHRHTIQSTYNILCCQSGLLFLMCVCEWVYHLTRWFIVLIVCFSSLYPKSCHTNREFWLQSVCHRQSFKWVYEKKSVECRKKNATIVNMKMWFAVRRNKKSCIEHIHVHTIPCREWEHRFEVQAILGIPFCYLQRHQTVTTKYSFKLKRHNA